MDSKNRRSSADSFLVADARQEAQRREQLINRVATYNRRHSLDLFRFELSDDADGYLGALRFTYIDEDQEITKAVRLNSSASARDIVPTLLEKFNREHGAANTHQLAVVANGVERVLAPDERPLEVALTTGGSESPKFVLRLTKKKQRTPSDISNDAVSLSSTISSTSVLGQSVDQGSISNMSSSDFVDRSTGDVQNPALQPIVLREKNKTKGQKFRHSMAGTLSPGSGQNRQSSLWKPFRVNRTKSVYETKTAGQLAQEHMKNMTQIGILQVYGVGIAPESHSQYKSVLTKKSSTTKEIIKAALERYNLEGRDEKNYLLCDVIGEWDEDSRPLVSPLLESSVQSPSPEVSPRTWTTHYSRVLQPEENPLILQALWKSEEGYERRFELRKRPPFGRHSVYDISASTADESLESGCYQHPTATPFLINLRGYDLTREFLIYRLIEDVTAVGRENVQNGIGSNRHNITLTGPDILPVHCLIHQRITESTNHLTDEEMQTWLEPTPNAHIALNGGKIDSPNIILPGDLLSIGSHHLFLFKDPSQAKEMMQGLHWEKAPLSQLESRAQSYHSETAGSTKLSPGTIRRQRSGMLYADDNSSLASSIADSAVRQRLDKRLAFPYDAPDEDALVEQVVLHTDTVSVPCKLAPAYLLAMIVEHSYKAHGFQLTQELVRKLAELIQEVIWEKTRNLSDKALSRNDSQDQSPVHSLFPNIQPVVFWMSNIVELLHYLCVKLPVQVSCQRTPKSSSASPPSLRQVLGKQTQDSIAQFEEALQFAFQQILFPLTKVLYSVLPLLIEGSPFDSEPTASAAITTRDIDNVLCVMQAVYDLMSECCLNRAIISQMFANLFFFINASLVNTLLDNGASQKYYHWTKGVQIRGSLDLFDAWALKNGLRKEFLQYTARLSTVADFLATTKECLLQMSWTLLRNDFPSLHPAQLHHLLSEYQLSSDVERPSHWLPSETESELANDRDSLLEEFDSCPPLFMPASQFWLDLEYEPPGEGFQLVVDELRKLCDGSGEEEQEVCSDLQEISVLSLERSQLDDETVIRTGLGVVTPPPVNVAQLDVDDSIISTPAVSPLPQTLRQEDDDKSLLEIKTHGNDAAEEDKEVNFVGVVDEEPVDTLLKESQPIEEAEEEEEEEEEEKGRLPPDQPVLVPPPRPALVPPPRPVLVLPPPPPQCPDEQSAEVPHASMVESQSEDSEEVSDDDDEGEVEMDLVFSTVVSDHSEESPQPDVTATVFEKQCEPLETNSMAYVDKMVEDLQPNSNSSSSAEENSDSESQSEEEDDPDPRQRSADTPDRDTDVAELMAKAALLLGDDNDECSPPPQERDKAEASKKLQDQSRNSKGRKQDRKKQKEVTLSISLSTVKEEPETHDQDGNDRTHQDVIIVKMQTGTTGVGVSLMDGNTMPMAVPGIFISSIAPNSPAALTNQLQVGDQILAIGNQSMTTASEQLARHCLKSSTGEVTLVVAKSRVQLRTTRVI